MNNNELWSRVLELIEKETTKVSFDTWFVPTKIYNVDDDLKIVYLKAESEFYANLLKNRYMQMLEESFATILGEKYRIVIKKAQDYENLEQEKKSNLAIANGKPGVTQFLKEQRIFNPKYTFDNFVVGNANKYAHAVALAVAESPSQAYNPLFIYGGSGLGKTHLIHAIGIYMLEHYPDINILYVSSEMFTNELIKSLREKKTNEFKEKYRQADVLLIDDIQFLENKETTQEEFFWTFNDLYNRHKQIVITGDRPPNELTRLDERLRTRFGWNIVASISAPDYETRVAVLMKKAENANIQVEVGDDMYQVICLIAEKIKDNIRELEGAFNRIITFSSLMKEKVDIPFARRILKDLMQGGDGVTPEKIKSVVARKYKIQVADLDSSTRLKKIAYPRQIAMYLCRTMTEDSFEKIGNNFGGRHYSTVMHACEKIQKDREKDESLKRDLDTLEKEIEE